MFLNDSYPPGAINQSFRVNPAQRSHDNRDYERNFQYLNVSVQDNREDRRMSSVTIRQLRNHAEYQQCVRLQRETWGENFTEVVNPAIQMVGQKLGGVTAGAFDESGMMIGFVFGLTGLMNGEIVHWSDMLAVRAEWRDKGIGRELKLFQREEMLKHGVRSIYWTYDPLEARNAYLNLQVLGARISEYVRNMYATDEGSPLHAGLGMDRFIVRWQLTEERVERAIRGEPPSICADIESAPIVNSKETPQSGIEPHEWDLPDASFIRVEIPREIQRLKKLSPDSGLRWRLNTRRVFEHYLSRGYSVEMFSRDFENNRCFYVLTKP